MSEIVFPVPTKVNPSKILKNRLVGVLAFPIASKVKLNVPSTEDTVGKASFNIVKFAILQPLGMDDGIVINLGYGEYGIELNRPEIGGALVEYVNEFIVILRIAQKLTSHTYRFPDGSIAIPPTPCNLAFVPSDGFVNDPETAPPATVVTYPPGVIFRTRPENISQR